LFEPIAFYHKSG